MTTALYLNENPVF